MSFNDQLQELQYQISRRKRLENILNDLRTQKEELETKIAALETAKQNEQADVERLEGRTLAAFFYAVIGQKGEKLNRERREAYEAAVLYDAAVLELTSVKNDIARYQSERSELHGCEERYAQLLKEKEKQIQASNIPEAAQLNQFDEQLTLLKSQITETEEAISAGRTAYSYANTILDSLDSAESWGTWDVIGGGMIADIVKHDHLDNAQSQVERLQVQLRRFKTELSDISIRADIQVNIDGFLRFSDFFFDGIFSDWAVLDHISASQTQVKEVRGKITAVLDKLEALKTSLEQEYSRLQKLRSQCISSVRL